MHMRRFFLVGLTVMFLLSEMAVFAAAGIPQPAGTGVQSARQAICEILQNIGWLLTAIAAAIGIVVIVLQGIKWAGSAEDPGARKQAKQGIIHAVIGLIIVVLAVWIVEMVMANECW